MMAVTKAGAVTKPRKRTPERPHAARGVKTKYSTVEAARDAIARMDSAYGEYTIINADELHVDDYQRPINERWVDSVIQTYDPALFHPLIVALREDDNLYYVVDGQHRLEVARRLGVQRVPCILHLETTIQQEARLFTDMQERRLSLAPSQRYNARLVAEDPETVAIHDLIGRYDFRVSEGRAITNATKDTIAATHTLYVIYRMGTPKGEILAQSLSILRDAWHGNPDSLTSAIMRGIAQFLREYGTDRNFSRADFVARLKSYAPRDIRTRVAAISASLGCSTGTAAAQSYLELYNRQRTARRLDGSMLGRRQ